MDTDKPKLITGRRFLQALGDAGIIQVSDRVRRVVIDADVQNTLLVYVERYGDSRFLDVVPAMSGVEVREVGRQVEAPTTPDEGMKVP